MSAPDSDGSYLEPFSKPIGPKSSLEELKRYLLEGKPDSWRQSHSERNTEGATLMYFASENGDLDKISLLLEYKADPNIPTQNTQRTPLHAAATSTMSEKLLVEVVKKLISAGAKINFQDRWGQTPLYLASQTNHLELVDLFLQNKADPNLTNEYGETALFRPCEFGFQSIVKSLLNYKANPTVEDKHGRDALFWACKGLQMDIIDMLLDAGAVLKDISGELLAQSNLARTFETLLIKRIHGKEGLSNIEKYARLRQDYSVMTDPRVIAFNAKMEREYSDEMLEKFEKDKN